MSKSKFLLIFLIILIMSGCSSQEEPVTFPPGSLDPVPVQIMISEVLTGVEGNNQAEKKSCFTIGDFVVPSQWGQYQEQLFARETEDGWDLG